MLAAVFDYAVLLLLLFSSKWITRHSRTHTPSAPCPPPSFHFVDMRSILSVCHVALPGLASPVRRKKQRTLQYRHATMRLQDMEDMYSEATEKGAAFLEAPVSGSKVRWLMMAGGRGSGLLF